MPVMPVMCIPTRELHARRRTYPRLLMPIRRIVPVKHHQRFVRRPPRPLCVRWASGTTPFRAVCVTLEARAGRPFDPAAMRSMGIGDDTPFRAVCVTLEARADRHCRCRPPTPPPTLTAPTATGPARDLRDAFLLAHRRAAAADERSHPFHPGGIAVMAEADLAAAVWADKIVALLHRLGRHLRPGAGLPVRHVDLLRASGIDQIVGPRAFQAGASTYPSGCRALA
jgi:hypothetical protein